MLWFFTYNVPSITAISIRVFPDLGSAMVKRSFVSSAGGSKFWTIDATQTSILIEIKIFAFLFYSKKSFFSVKSWTYFVKQWTGWGHKKRPGTIDDQRLCDQNWFLAYFWYGLGIGGKVRRNVEAKIRSSLPISMGLTLLMPKSRTGLTLNCNFVRIFEDFLL